MSIQFVELILIIVALISLLGMIWIKLFRNRNRRSASAVPRRKKIDPQVMPTEPSVAVENIARRTAIDNRAHYASIKAERKVTINKIPLPASKTEIKTDADKRIVIYLKSLKDSPYGGYELIQCLAACNMQFGEMNLFHRYEAMNENRILFSLAAATPSGSFELSTMGGFFCKGLVLFCNAHSEKNLLHCFENMLLVADQLIEDLGGILLDEYHQELSSKRILSMKEEMRVLSD